LVDGIAVALDATVSIAEDDARRYGKRLGMDSAIKLHLTEEEAAHVEIALKFQLETTMMPSLRT
jgi:hypothetical protein